ncbi:MAG TPA: type II toxin-antitoxin system prevent-host-death family antitoxin [Gaiellaceae bacterium]
MEVGIRELRADLSRWVRRVGAGEEIVVTDRGKAVARLVPVDGERKIDRLIREGLVIPAPRPWRGKLPKPIEGAGPVSDLVIEDRG